MLEDFVRVLSSVLSVFNHLNISFVVGGSVASSIYGIPRATNDIDILADISSNQGRQVVKMLRDEFYIDPDRVNEAIRTKASFSIIHLKSIHKLDIFIRGPHPWLEQEMNRSRLESIGSGNQALTIPVSSAEDNILHKLEWYRMGGEVSERQWSDVLGILRVQKQNLDMDYLQGWAATLNLADLLKRAIQEAQIP